MLNNAAVKFHIGYAERCEHNNMHGFFCFCVIPETPGLHAEFCCVFFIDDVRIHRKFHLAQIDDLIAAINNQFVRDEIFGESVHHQ